MADHAGNTSTARNATVARITITSSRVISADGQYAAFVSGAPGLVPGIHGDVLQVYLRDRVEATTRLVSRGADGVTAANRASTAPRMSADGRWILFQSRADNLVEEPTGQVENLFLWDRLSDTTRLVSLNRQGTAGGDKASYVGSVSFDGRWVLFESQASDPLSFFICLDRPQSIGQPAGTP